MKSQYNNRQELIRALKALTSEQRDQRIAGIDGAYNPHVLRLTKEWGLRESDGPIRSVDAEIAYQISKLP